MLAKQIPDLEVLAPRLTALPASHSLLASASSFSKLVCLDIEFSMGSSLSGSDLVMIAQACPGLRELYICEYDGLPPWAKGVTDSVVDTAAKHMGQLWTLILILDHSYTLTWKSVLSFARHCKHLVRLRLPCSLSWEQAMDSAPPDTFCKLWQLALDLDGNNRDNALAAPDTERQNIDSFAARLAAFAPRLNSFVIEGGSKADQALANAVDVICSHR